MPTNDFLPVATEGTPNVQDQADYAASSNREQGWPTGGVPSSAEWNKMMRQATFMASVLAQYMAQQTGEDMLDDGDIDAKVLLLLSSTRIKLLANTTFYVATTGDNTNSGLEVGDPWLTGQYAADFIAEKYDLNGFTATVQFADGTYTSNVLFGPMVGAPVGSPAISFRGNTGAPVNCKITAVGGGFSGAGSVFASVQGFQIQGTGPQSVAILAQNGARIQHGNNIFDASVQAHLDALTGGILEATADYTIIGGANNHIAAIQAGIIYNQSRNITLTGTPAFANGFCQADHNGNAFTSGCVFTGGATGSRYTVNTNGVIDTSGGGANYFPGNSAGVSATGGQYT